MTFFYAKNLRRTSKGRWVRPLISPLDVDGVGIDSRADLTGKAFVAIHGEHHDGHDYLAEATHAGARLLIVDREPAQVTLPRGSAQLPSGTEHQVKERPHHEQNEEKESRDE